MRFKSIALSIVASAIAGAALSVPAVAQEATWDRIKKRGTVIQACALQPPYWSQDKPGEWKGWGITAGNQLAADLKVKAECQEASFGTAALGIQSGKIDLMWAMQATPQRALAITFAGPLYNHGFMTINNKSFTAQNWDSYNKPGIRLACQAGASPCLVRRSVAPQATAIELTTQQDATLAVIAGRADAMVVTVLNGIYAKDRNPDLGSFVIPQPLFSFPAYVGVPNEIDARFRDFMHWWSEWYRLQGDVEKWIKDAMIEAGVKPESIPEKLYL